MPTALHYIIKGLKAPTKDQIKLCSYRATRSPVYFMYPDEKYNWLVVAIRRDGSTALIQEAPFTSRLRATKGIDTYAKAAV